jgi:hypothetical protein
VCYWLPARSRSSGSGCLLARQHGSCHAHARSALQHQQQQQSVRQVLQVVQCACCGRGSGCTPLTGLCQAAAATTAAVSVHVPMCSLCRGASASSSSSRGLTAAVEG